MSVLIVIPARYASTRYPGKPLVPLAGATGEKKTLIERSWQAAQQVAGIDRVVVATDDDRIEVCAREFGADVIMTSSKCVNGTERCAEVSKILKSFDIIVNLQGDAPLTPPWFVESLVAALEKTPNISIATPVLRCNGAMLQSLKDDRAAGRVGGTTAVFDADSCALYFSKEVLPFTSEQYGAEEPTPVFHHVGVYAYRPDALLAYSDLDQGKLETLEGLEQLRFMENGKQVLCVEVDAQGRDFWELNNPSDVDRIERILAHTNTH